MKNSTLCKQTAILGFIGAIFVSPTVTQALTIEEVINPRHNNGWVTDMADILSDRTEAELNGLITDLEQNNDAEIAFVTVPETAPAISPKAFATGLFNYGGNGTKTLISLLQPSVDAQNYSKLISTINNEVETDTVNIKTSSFIAVFLTIIIILLIVSVLADSNSNNTNHNSKKRKQRSHNAHDHRRDCDNNSFIISDFFSSNSDDSGSDFGGGSSDGGGAGDDF